MAIAEHRNGVRLADVNWWYVLSAIFAAITAISALGEWVFHWWKDPGDVLAYLGFIATLVTLGFGASKTDIRTMDRRFDRIELLLSRSLETQQAMKQLQEKTNGTLERQSATLERQSATLDRLSSTMEEAVRFFRETRAGT